MTRAHTTIQPLPAGDAGTFYTLSHMAQFVRRDVADPMIRGYAEQLTSHVEPHDFEGEVDAIFEYVQSLPYRRHPVDVQRVLDAHNAIASASLDCVSKSVLLATLLGALGHVSRFAIVRQGGGEFDHVYVETQLNGRWLPLDPTPDERSGGARQPGWEVGGAAKSVYSIWPGAAAKMGDSCCGNCASGKPCDGLGATPAGGGGAGVPIAMIAQDAFQLIMTIWQAHSAKVYQEDEVSGAWTALGRPIIDDIKESYDAGTMSLDEAYQALDLLYHQFLIQVQPISKLEGHFGHLPDPKKPRPSSNCNWACGTSWDLYWELDELKKEMASQEPGGMSAWKAAGYSSKSAWKAAGKPSPPIIATTPGSIGSSVTSMFSGIPKEYLLGGAALIALLLLKK